MSSTYSDGPVGQSRIDPIATMSSTIHTHRRISWAAVFGGVILVVAVQLLLSLSTLR